MLNPRDDRFIRYRLVNCVKSGYISIMGVSRGSGGEMRSVLAEGGIILSLAELRRCRIFCNRSKW